MEEVGVEDMKFSLFCKVCERVRSQKSKQKAGEVLEKFVGYVMKSNPPSFYPILRLLLPQLDRERGPYGVKETNLARTYKRILGLAPNSSEGKMLTHFNAPSTIRSGAMGDFAEVLCCILRNRCGDGNVMTIGDVNKRLDNIALKHSQQDPRGVDDEYTEMVNLMSSNEQKWVVKIILKSMDLRLGTKKILSIYHPDANYLYVLSNSILKVCEKLKDRTIRYYELCIELFQPFRPMLCERGDVHNLSISSPHYAETKMDGERFQIHFKNGTFKYFSRNGYDYTDTYGENPDVGQFTSILMKQLSPDVQSFILDGEMMGWHTSKKHLVSKGANIDVKHLRLGSTLQPCFCVFDILLYNDVIITSKPLSERAEIVSNVVTPLEGVIMHVSRDIIHNTQEAFDALNDAIDNNDEGIIIKDPTSVYLPNSRKQEWRKFKPDYSEGTVDLDLLIIGGYYGSGRRKGKICHFLLGVADESSGEPEKFMSVARASSGISDTELEELSTKLAPHWIKFKGKTPPFLLLKKEKPDVFIDPRNSVILQVKSPEVVRSDAYFTECTLRFVRVERIRYDKLWLDCLKINEFNRLKSSAGGKLTSGHIMPNKNLRKRKMERNVNEPAEKVEKISDILSGKEICIMNGGKDLSKADLEKLVKQYGGSVSQQPSSSTFCVLYNDENIRVRNLVRSKKHNITKISWLLACIEEGRLVPWNRQNLISADLKTESVISEKFDIYGDDYFEPLTHGTLVGILNTMDSVHLCTEEMKEIDSLLFNGNSPFSLFRDYCVFFDLCNISDIRPTLKNAEIIYKFHSGSVSTEVNTNTSYIIMDEYSLENLAYLIDLCEKNNLFCTFVSQRWITDSFNSNMLKAYDDYIIHRLEPEGIK